MKIKFYCDLFDKKISELNTSEIYDECPYPWIECWTCEYFFGKVDEDKDDLEK